jgi:hypothetical protein
MHVMCDRETELSRSKARKLLCIYQEMQDRD